MNKKKVIAILGTLDTKEQEMCHVKRLIEEHGHRSLLIDTGMFNKSPAYADVSRDLISKIGAGRQIDIQQLDRGRATEVMQKGTRELVLQLYKERRIDGILALGGSGGTSIALPALACLPVGFPKILLTSLAMGALGTTIDGTDVIVVNTVTDILGLNSMNRGIFKNAVASISAMVKELKEETPERIRVAVSAFGITTPAVINAKVVLENEGYDVLVFSSNGVGGRTLERLTREGEIHGVLDLTITELADEVAGGVLSAGPDRLEAPGNRGIPHVVAPGAIDVVNFRGFQPVPSRFRHRLFFRHSPITLLMRTSVSESQRLGKLVAQKLNKAKGKTAILIPLHGFSAYDKPGGPFYDPVADKAFVTSFRRHVDPHVEVIEMDCHINDQKFAEAAVSKLLDFMKTEVPMKKLQTSSLEVPKGDLL